MTLEPKALRGHAHFDIRVGRPLSWKKATLRAISHPPKLAFSSFRAYFLKYTEIQMYRKSFLLSFAAATSLFCFALCEAQTMTSKLIVSLLAHESICHTGNASKTACLHKSLVKKVCRDSLATCSWKMCSTVVVNQSLGLFDWGLSEMDNCKLWLEYLPCIRHVKISWTEKIYSTNCKNPLESKSKRETTIIHSIQWACLHPARNIYANLLNWTSLPFNTF